jgi:hypothetical protein
MFHVEHLLNFTKLYFTTGLHYLCSTFSYLTKIHTLPHRFIHNPKQKLSYLYTIAYTSSKLTLRQEITAYSCTIVPHGTIVHLTKKTLRLLRLGTLLHLLK